MIQMVNSLSLISLLAYFLTSFSRKESLIENRNPKAKQIENLWIGPLSVLKILRRLIKRKIKKGNQ